MYRRAQGLVPFCTSPISSVFRYISIPTLATMSSMRAINTTGSNLYVRDLVFKFQFSSGGSVALVLKKVTENGLH